jgi:hypothetical protein
LSVPAAEAPRRKGEERSQTGNEAKECPRREEPLRGGEGEREEERERERKGEEGREREKKEYLVIIENQSHIDSYVLL